MKKAMKFYKRYVVTYDQFKAAREGNIEWFRGNHYDACRKDNCGRTALMYAMDSNDEDFCVFLLSQTPTRAIDLQCATGWTTLMYSVNGGLKRMTKLLLSKGASTKIKNMFGEKVERYAILYGDQRLRDILETFSRTPRTLKYYVLKSTPATSNKVLLKWNSYEKEIKCQ